MLPVLIAFAMLSGLIGLGLWFVEGLPTPLFLHATIMVIAWVGILPIGALVARYSKITRLQHFPVELDNHFWWNWHRALQHAGVMLSIIALSVIILDTGGSFRTLHGKLGLLLLALSVAQIAGTALRGTKGGPTDPTADPQRPETWRGDHFDMTPRRRRFELAHKTLGWFMLLCAGAVVVLGIVLIGAPDWLLMVVGSSYLALILAAADRAKEGRKVDTYVAIWGSLRSPMLTAASLRKPRNVRLANRKDDHKIG